MRKRQIKQQSYVMQNPLVHNKSILHIFFITNIKSLTFIIKKAIPSMLIWWLIWILIISLIPQNSIDNLRNVSILPVLLVSIISFILPVPMLFDIVFSGVIYNSSIPSIYSIIILLNLWWFSIYPFLVLKQDIKIFHLYLFSVIFISISIILSYSIYTFKNYIPPLIYFEESWNLENNYDINESIYSLSANDIEKFFNPKISSYNSSLLHSSNEVEPIHKVDPQLLSQKFINKEENTTGVSLQIIKNEDIGIWFHWYKLWSIMHGVGVSDYNNDGYDDLIFWSSKGIKIYKNLWWYFHIDNNIVLWKVISNSEVTLANFYDLDGDQWKDLIISTKNEWYFIIWNNKGQISIKNSIRFKKNNPNSSNYSISLWDLYNNGTVDIFIWEYNFWDRPQGATNSIIINSWNRELEILDMDSLSLWSTISSLIWDFDNDGINEIYEWNDGWKVSDFIYTITEWKIIPHPKMKEIIPYTTFWTKGLSIWDIDNDLFLDYFISWNNETLKVKNEALAYEDFCNHPRWTSDFSIICWLKYLIKDFAFNKLQINIDNIYLKSLVSQLSQVIYVHENDNVTTRENICNSIKTSYHFWSLYKNCLNTKDFTLKPYNEKNVIWQKNGSILFTGNNKLKINLLSSSISETIWWAWGSIFIDINNAWKEDLYIGTWHFWTYPVTSNIILSISNNKVQNVTEEKWWQNFLNTISSVSIDIENDGDLDIVSISDQGDILIFKNQSYGNNSIAIQLIDKKSSNSEWLWSRILIEDSFWNKQIKPIYVWGWPLSLQSTTAYFGIWKSDSIEKVTIYWSDNSITQIDTTLKWNQKYSIIRQ